MNNPRLETNSRLNNNNLRVCSFWLIGFCILANGCALSAQRVHPEFEARALTVNRAVLVPFDVSMLELMPSGLIRPREDWRAEGLRNLRHAIFQYLKDHQCTLQPLVLDSDTAREMAEIQALYRLVQKSMWQQTFKSNNGTQTGQRFEYSIGSIKGLLDKLGADSLIFVSGYQRISRSGHKSLIKLAITDSSGSVLYYSVRGSTRRRDLRDPAGAVNIVNELFCGFSRINS